MEDKLQVLEGPEFTENGLTDYPVRANMQEGCQAAIRIT